MLLNSPVVSQFAVPGAELYSEARRAGPLLLFVVGGNGDPAVFSAVADRLAADFTVVSYARRGFARSPVDGTSATPSTPASSPPRSAGWLARMGERYRQPRWPCAEQAVLLSAAAVGLPYLRAVRPRVSSQ